jgi:hypothetical protein
MGVPQLPHYPVINDPNAELRAIMGDFMRIQGEANRENREVAQEQQQLNQGMLNLNQAAQHNHDRERVPKPVKFWGNDDQCVEDFLQSFAAHIGDRPMEDRNKVMAMQEFLGEAPLNAIETLPPDERWIPANVINLLKERWSDERARFRNQNRFHQTMQTPDQTIEGFLDTLIKLRRKGWPNDAQGWDQSMQFKEQVQHRFLKGLTDVVLRENLFSSQLTHDWETISYKEFLALLRRAQKVVRSKKTNLPNPPTNPIQYQPRDKAHIRCARCSKMGHYARECTETIAIPGRNPVQPPLALQPIQYLQPQGDYPRALYDFGEPGQYMETNPLAMTLYQPPQGGSAGVYQDSVQAITGGPGGQCYYCKSPQHFARECPVNPSAFVTRSALREELQPIKDVCEQMGALIKSHATTNQLKGPPAKAPVATTLSILPAGMTTYPEGMTVPHDPVITPQPIEIVNPDDESRLAYLTHQQRARTEVQLNPQPTQGTDPGN